MVWNKAGRGTQNRVGPVSNNFLIHGKVTETTCLPDVKT